MYPDNSFENKFERQNSEQSERRELTEDELREQEAYHQQLNDTLYGDFSEVTAANQRETNVDAENSLTASAMGNIDTETAKQQLHDTRGDIEDRIGVLSSEMSTTDVRFGDIDTRLAEATSYAKATDRIGEDSVLLDDDKLRVEKAIMAEAAIKSYLEGRNNDLFDDIDESFARDIKISISQLLEKYGDITKASSSELEGIYNKIESAKGTKKEVSEETASDDDSNEEGSEEQSIAQEEGLTGVEKLKSDIALPPVQNDELKKARGDIEDAYKAIRQAAQ